jgi:hypothetical protein
MKLKRQVGKCLSMCSGRLTFWSLEFETVSREGSNTTGGGGRSCSLRDTQRLPFSREVAPLPSP